MPRPPHFHDNVLTMPGAVYSPFADRLADHPGPLFPLHVGDPWLEPCVGAIIAITGHTDKSGNEADNVSLSMDRARVVREALVRRGIPREGLRARGYGSSRPVSSLTAEDPANRRIEFSVIRMEPLKPTPVDTPGPR